MTIHTEFKDQMDTVLKNSLVLKTLNAKYGTEICTLETLVEGTDHEYVAIKVEFTGVATTGNTVITVKRNLDLLDHTSTGNPPIVSGDLPQLALDTYNEIIDEFANKKCDLTEFQVL